VRPIPRADGRRSVLFQKHCKAADRLQKFLSAGGALYATGCHNGDCIHQTYELDHSIAPKIQFNLRGFSNQFKPFPVEPFSYRHENIVRGDHPAISLNVRRPSTQKPQKFPPSILLSVIQSMFASYMETVSADAEFSEPTDGGTKSAPDSRIEPNLRCVKLNIGHLIIWGFTSGIISFLAGSKARNIIPNELKPRLIPRARDPYFSRSLLGLANFFV